MQICKSNRKLLTETGRPGSSLGTVEATDNSIFRELLDLAEAYLGLGWCLFIIILVERIIG